MVDAFVQGDKSLLVIEVKSAGSGETTMLLPLVLRDLRGYKLITWLDFGVVDYAAPLVAPGVQIDEAFARRAWKAVLSALPSVDLIHIDRIPATCLDRPNPLALLKSCSLSRTQSHQVEVEPEAAAFTQPGAKPSTSREMARRNRRLAECGPVRFVRASAEDEVETLFAALLQQRRERFAGLGRVDLLSTGSYAEFYRRCALDGLRGGCVRLFGLAVGDLWLATLYGLESPSMFHTVIPTMREGEWRRFSPGLLLIERVMAWSRAQGHEIFDFSIGDLAYKSDFGANPSPLYELFETNSSRGFLIKTATTGLVSSKAWLSRQPQIFELLRRTRQQIRRNFSI